MPYYKVNFRTEKTKLKIYDPYQSTMHHGGNICLKQNGLKGFPYTLKQKGALNYMEQVALLCCVKSKALPSLCWVLHLRPGSKQHLDII